MNHKFSKDAVVKCEATIGQLIDVGVSYKPENYSGEQVKVEPIGGSVRWANTRYEGELGYNMSSIGKGSWRDVLTFPIPESLLKETI